MTNLEEQLNKALQIESQSTKEAHQSKNAPALGPSKGDANQKKKDKPHNSTRPTRSSLVKHK